MSDYWKCALCEYPSNYRGTRSCGKCAAIRRWEAPPPTGQEIPHGPSHAEAVRLAVMAERARWVHAMEGVVDDLRHRRDVCRDPREDGDEVAYIGRARGYEIAANTLKASITATMEESNQ